MPEPLLSIVVLARNCRQTLTVCLESLLETMSDLGLESELAEYVLIDDCSEIDES